MPFIIEDGIGRRGANSYITVAALRDYADTRGISEFESLDDEMIQQDAVRATDYIERRWSEQFKGERLRDFQGLSWPRKRAYDRHGDLIERVPPSLCEAAIELAIRSRSVDKLMADPPSPYPVKDRSGAIESVSSGEILSTRRTVGPLTRVTTFAHSGLQRQSRVTSKVIAGVTSQEYPEVYQLVRPLLTSSADNTRVIRN